MKTSYTSILSVILFIIHSTSSASLLNSQDSKCALVASYPNNVYVPDNPMYQKIQTSPLLKSNKINTYQRNEKSIYFRYIVLKNDQEIHSFPEDFDDVDSIISITISKCQEQSSPSPSPQPFPSPSPSYYPTSSRWRYLIETTIPELNSIPDCSLIYYHRYEGGSDNIVNVIVDEIYNQFGRDSYSVFYRLTSADYILIRTSPTSNVPFFEPYDGNKIINLMKYCLQKKTN